MTFVLHRPKGVTHVSTRSTASDPAVRELENQVSASMRRVSDHLGRSRYALDRSRNPATGDDFFDKMESKSSQAEAQAEHDEARRALNDLRELLLDLTRHSEPDVVRVASAAVDEITRLAACVAGAADEGDTD